MIVGDKGIRDRNSERQSKKQTNKQKNTDYCIKHPMPSLNHRGDDVGKFSE